MARDANVSRRDDFGNTQLDGDESAASQSDFNFREPSSELSEATRGGLRFKPEILPPMHAVQNVDL